MKEALEFAAGGQAFVPYSTEPLPRIVALGGGNGLSTLLKGLRPLYFPEEQAALTAAERERLTAIVTVADDGGSTGQLRKAYPMLAPGDIRNCLLALAGSDTAWQRLFDFRFNGNVDSHSLGNLILTALAQMEDNFTRGIERASALLDVRGQVLPATPDNVTLEAICSDGTRICGESHITAARKKIERIELVPSKISTLPQASSALEKAEVIVLGPGSLYTSLMPILLVPGIADAIAASRAPVIYIMNLMTEPGETDGYAPLDFLRAIRRHAPGIHIEYVLQNGTPIPQQQRARYGASGAGQIQPTAQRVPGFSCRPVFRDLFGDSGNGEKIRHDSDKLARAVVDIARDHIAADAQTRKQISPARFQFAEAEVIKP